MKNNRGIELVDAGLDEDIDILQFEIEGGIELITDLSDRLAAAVGTDDIAESVQWFEDTLQKLGGLQLTPERRDELFAIAREAGFSIADAAKLAGMSKSTGYVRAGENSEAGNFPTNTDKESAVRDYVEQHPDASNREVAIETGVDHKTVGAIKNRPPPVTVDAILENSPEYQQSKRDVARAGAMSAASNALLRLSEYDPVEIARDCPIASRATEHGWVHRAMDWLMAYDKALEDERQLKLVGDQ